MTDLLDGIRELVRELVREEVRAALADMQKPDEMMTIAEVAAHAHVHADTVRRWIRENRLGEHRAGRLVRVRRAELDALLDAAPASSVRMPPRDGGRFVRGERVERTRTRRDPEELSPEELARRDFGG